MLDMQQPVFGTHPAVKDVVTLRVCVCACAYARARVCVWMSLIWLSATSPLNMPATMHLTLLVSLLTAIVISGKSAFFNKFSLLKLLCSICLRTWTLGWSLVKVQIYANRKLRAVRDSLPVCLWQCGSGFCFKCNKKQPCVITETFVFILLLCITTKFIS